MANIEDSFILRIKNGKMEVSGRISTVIWPNVVVNYGQHMKNKEDTKEHVVGTKNTKINESVLDQNTEKV